MVPRRCWVGVGAAMLMLAAACRRVDDARPAPRMLAANASIEAPLAGNHHAQLAVVAAIGDYVELDLEQRGVDASLDIRGPYGQPIVDALDVTGGVSGHERFGFVALAPGRYTLDISASYPSIARGAIRLALRGPAPSTSTDRLRAAAYALTDQLATLLGWKPDRSPDATGEQRTAAMHQSAALRATWAALGERRGEAAAYELGATAARQLSRGTEAEQLSDQAIAIYRALGERYAEANALLERGSARFIQGDIAEARRSWERARMLAEQAGDPGTAAVALGGLGVASLSVEDYRRGRDELTAARAAAAAIGRDDTVAIADDNLGRAFARLGEAGLALDHYARSIAGLERAGMSLEAGRVYHARALVERDLLDDPVTARRDLERGLELLRGAGDRAGQSLALVDLGLAHRAADQPALARQRLDEAVALGRAIGNPHLIARARAAQGMIALDQVTTSDDRTSPQQLASIELALAAYAEARDGFAKVGRVGAEALALVGHARALIARGELDAARTEVGQALAMLDDVRSRAPSPELRATYFASVRSAYDLDIELEMLLDAGRNGPHAVAAFEASERGRARSLLELLRQGGTVDDPTPTAPEHSVDDANAEIARLEAAHDRLLRGTPTPAALQASEDAIDAAIDRQRVALDALRARDPRAAELFAPRALRLSAVQALLDPDTVLLEYVVAEPRSFVFAVDRRSLTVRALPARPAIEAAARAARDALTARNAIVADETPAARAARIARADADAPALTAKLAALVIDPIADRIAGQRRVLIAPDGALAHVPFAALPARDTSLIDDHDVIMLPSASVLAALRARPSHPAAQGRVAILADPVYGPGDPRMPAANATATNTDATRDAVPPLASLPRLTFAADEAAAIARLVPSDRLRLATGLDARRDLLTSGALADYAIVHIATHGLVNARHPDLSGLVMAMVDARGAAQDGFLRLHELYRLSLGAELVTLSGCETALGREIRGEGVIGLARGFLHAGARRVVASLWQVHDRATAELMRRFYDAMLVRGLAPPAALRQAQRELRDHTPYAAPYFWAAFELQGDDRP